MGTIGRDLTALTALTKACAAPKEPSHYKVAMGAYEHSCCIIMQGFGDQEGQGGKEAALLGSVRGSKKRGQGGGSSRLGEKALREFGPGRGFAAQLRLAHKVWLESEG